MPPQHPCVAASASLSVTPAGLAGGSCTRRHWLQLALGSALGGSAVLLSGCASPGRRTVATDGSAGGYWSGRLALQVDSEPVQSWSAAFELMGRPEAGELRIASPLGQTLAQLHWQPGQAQLLRGSQREQRPSLAALVRELTGTDIPIEALFAWLKGHPANAAGWEVDLTRQPQGRIIARRLQPMPATTLRLQFEP